MSVAVVLGTLSVMLTGGQVEKKPAELPALATLAVMTVEPGCCAVATPFSSMETMLLVWAAKVRWPTWQLMLVETGVETPVVGLKLLLCAKTRATS